MDVWALLGSDPPDIVFRVAATTSVAAALLCALVYAVWQPVLRGKCSQPVPFVLFFTALAVGRAEYRIATDAPPTWWGGFFWIALAVVLSWWLWSLWTCRNDSEDVMARKEADALREAQARLVTAAVERARADFREDVRLIGDELFVRGEEVRRQQEAAVATITGRIDEAAAAATAHTVAVLEPKLDAAVGGLPAGGGTLGPESTRVDEDEECVAACRSTRNGGRDDDAAGAVRGVAGGHGDGGAVHG